VIEGGREREGVWKWSEERREGRRKGGRERKREREKERERERCGEEG